MDTKRAGAVRRKNKRAGSCIAKEARRVGPYRQLPVRTRPRQSPGPAEAGTHATGGQIQGEAGPGLVNWKGLPSWSTHPPMTAVPQRTLGGHEGNAGKRGQGWRADRTTARKGACPGTGLTL